MKITQAVPAIFAALAALTMKTIITSNWRVRHRAFCVLLLGIAALWAMPRTARAQTLYVVQDGNYPVSAYDVSTNPATLIYANFIPNSPGQMFGALAVSGNNLYVMKTGPTTVVSEYDATTGVAINDTQTGFVTTVDGTATVTFAPQFSQIPIVTFPLSPVVATVASETTTGFVVNSVDPTGLPVNATFTWVATGGTGSITVLGALGGFPGFLALSGNDLFVSTQLATTVGEYDVTNGVAINASLITGLPPLTSGLAVSGNDLFVGSLQGTVAEYNATTGVANNPPASSRGGLPDTASRCRATASSWRPPASANTTYLREPLTPASSRG